MAKQITEQQVEQIINKLIERVEQANVFFLKNIGSFVKQLKELTPSKAQQLAQILKYGGNYEDIIREISKLTNMNIKDIDEIFSEYAKKDQMFYKDFYEYRDKPFVPFEENNVLQRQTQALSNIVKNEMYNFTRDNVLGYTIRDLRGKTQFLGLRETYNRVLDEALLNVGQGKETFDSAMTNILKQIGGSGLKTIEYESGRSMRLDSAIRMHLKGRLRELHNENQKIIGDEIGADGVEISVHSNPAPDHELVQGRQFSNTEFDKLQNGQEAEDYNGVSYTLDHDHKNGYRPISEMNCYHYVFSVVLGVNKPEYTDKQLKQIITNNDKGFEFEGEHYTNYEGTQMQRQLERKIREQKDIQIFAKASNNEELIDQSQQNIRILTNKYKELSDASGLPTKAQRMKVSGYKRTKTQISDNLQRKTKNIIEYKKNKNKNVNYIEKIDLTNQKMINDKIINYRKNILWDTKENAFIIDKNGDVFSIVGSKANINIPKWLDQKQSIVIHNHPPNVTNYSFSKEDIDWFLSKEIKELYGDDTTFQYVIKRNKDTIIDTKDLSKDWSKYYNEVLELSYNGKIDIDVDSYDYIVKKIAKKYNFEYKRELQKLN